MTVLHRIPPHAPQAPCALTIGNFDGVHPGHQALLRRVANAATRGGLVPTVLTFEPHPRTYFARLRARGGPDGAPEGAPRRLQNLRDQMVALCAQGIRQRVIARFDGTLASLPAPRFVTDVLVSALGVRHLVIGADFRFGAGRTGDVALLRSMGETHGFTVETVPDVALDGERISSSAIRNALDQLDIPRASRLLGRPYTISGQVVHGRKLGRTWGFPTLNIRVGQDRPALHGIAVVQVSGLSDGPPLPAVASLGTRPAVEQNGRYLLEVHLLDWHGDAYGRLVTVEFLHALRPERPFPSFDALRDQIGADCQDARAWFDSRSPRPPD